MTTPRVVLKTTVGTVPHTKELRLVDKGTGDIEFEERGTDALGESVWGPWSELSCGPVTINYWGQLQGGPSSLVNERYYQLKVELLTKAIRGMK